MQAHHKERLIKLRKTGHSLNEIAQLTNTSLGTVWRCVHEVPVPSEYESILKSKRGGSALRAVRLRQRSREKCLDLFSDIKTRESVLILATLYWAEGTKDEFCFTNANPEMLKVFVSCLENLSIDSARLKVSVRIYEDMVEKKEEIITFWSQLLNVRREQVMSVSILKGKKEGKLKYGMCRLRLHKGDDCFKLIQSAIEVIQSGVAPIAQRIELQTPKL